MLSTVAQSVTPDPKNSSSLHEPRTASAQLQVLPFALKCKRWATRCFATMMLLIIAIETFPRSFNGQTIPLVNQVKAWTAGFTIRASLWQGEWPLFAPNPVLNNAWLTAEMTSPDGQTKNWNSTYWAEASTWEKFRRFRFMNYYNKLPFRGRAAANDFADYIARQEIAATAQPVLHPTASHENEQVTVAIPRWRLELFRQQMNMSLLDAGSLPTRDETYWVFSSALLTTREYQP